MAEQGRTKGAAGAPSTDILGSVTVTVAPGRTVVGGDTRAVPSTDLDDKGQRKVVQVPISKSYGPGQSLEVPAEEAARLLKLGAILAPGEKAEKEEAAAPLVRQDQGLQVKTA